MQRGRAEMEKGYTQCLSCFSKKILMFTYQCTIKEARNTYFSELVVKRGHNPRILFKTINSVIGPLLSQSVESSPERCEGFLNYFFSKKGEIRQHFNTEFRELDVNSCPPSTLIHFCEISLCQPCCTFKIIHLPFRLLSHLFFKSCISDGWSGYFRHY